MLPEQPPLARVIRVHPLPNEKPPQGFTWGDYDNVQISDRREDDADGKESGEWGVVENKRARKLLQPHYHLSLRHDFQALLDEKVKHLCHHNDQWPRQRNNGKMRIDVKLGKLRAPLPRQIALQG